MKLYPAILATLVVGAACSAQTLPDPGTTKLPDNAPVTNIKNVPASTGRANREGVPPPVAMTPMGTFNQPFALAFLPDGRLLVTEKAGTLKLRATDGQVADVAGVPAVTTQNVSGQGGLLDVAIAPDFTTSHTVYLSYSEPSAAGAGLALARATLDLSGAPSLQKLAVIWRSGRNGVGGQLGASIAFAPDGKSLFLSSGERQRFSPAQDPEQALGKILHLTLDGKAAPGNPQASAGGMRGETWSMGHRNSYGLAFAGDGRLWEIEMGPRGGDELNLIQPGKNYGWPLVSNGDNYSGQPIPDHPSRPDLVAPKLWWNPSISPGGILIYSGAMFPAYRGNLFVCALSGEGVIRIALSGATAKVEEQWATKARIRDIAQAPDGAIWLLGDGRNAKLLRLTPKG